MQICVIEVDEGPLGLCNRSRASRLSEKLYLHASKSSTLSLIGLLLLLIPIKHMRTHGSQPV